MTSTAFGDALFLGLVRVLGKPFFSDSVETIPFAAHLARTEITLPDRLTTGVSTYRARSGPYEIEGRLNLIHGGKPDAPLLIHHQGGGEAPFDRLALGMFPQDGECPFTVLAVESPYQSSPRTIASAFASLDCYVATIAVAVTTAQALLGTPIARAARLRIVSGYSLGGFIANRHHLAFNSADAYVPFAAGARHGEIFLSTVPAAPNARRAPEAIRAALNFDEEWAARAHPNVFPVLSQRDGLNLYGVQGPSYGDTPIETWPGGHLYGARRPRLLRDKIERVAAHLAKAQ